MKIILFILTLFAQTVRAQTVDVSSTYNGIKEEGGGVIVGFGNRRFIFTASHLSQGDGLSIKVNHNPVEAQIKGRLSYNEYDFELFEVPYESAPLVHAEWNPQRQEFFSTYNYTGGSHQKGQSFNANPHINLTHCLTAVNPVILVFNSQYDFSNRYSYGQEGYQKGQFQKLPIPHMCPIRDLIVSDITKQFVSDVPLFPGISGNPVYKRLSPQDKKDALLGLASATDSLTFRSYFTDRSIIKDVFKNYLNGANGALGTARWIMGKTAPYELYRTFAGSALVSEVEGKMVRGSTGRANRGQTGRANRGQTGRANRGQTGDAGITSDEFVFDYEALIGGQGLMFQGRRALGFRYNNISFEANLASYYWLKGKSFEVIWQDEPDKNKALAIHYINMKDGWLTLRVVNTNSPIEQMLKIGRKAQILIIFDPYSQNGVRIDMSIAKLKDVLFVPYTFMGHKHLVDLRSLFLLDISENNNNFDFNQAKKSRIVRLLRIETKDIDDFFRSESFYIEEP